MQDCLFCKIIAGEIPCKKVYEDDKTLAFYDVDPQAPIHILVIPKEHIQSIQALEEKDGAMVAHIFSVIQKLATSLELTDGYRVVCNCGKDGGQTVLHLHFHLLGGRSMNWPPG